MREVKTSGWDLKEVQMAANASINNVKNGFVGTGYYLGIIRSEKLWREDGSASFDEYMSRNYQKDKSWASKCISVYDQFGEQINPGDKPRLRAEYQEYNVSQLFELIYLPEEKREEVTPKTPVKAIRELKPKKEKKVSTVETPEATEEPETQLPACNTDMSSCPHRDGYSCTLTPGQKSTPGDGSQCERACCWECKYHGMCEPECDSSAGRDGERPEFDAAWFVRKWVEQFPNDLKVVMRICREHLSNADRAKAVQKYISPYGARCQCCWEYDFSFHGFAGGLDFRIGRVQIHLKYGRFVTELLALYDPSSPEYDAEIGELNLSCRTENTLKRAGIDTVEKLVSMSDEELAAVRGMSARTMEEIRTKLEDLDSVDKPEVVIDTDYEEVQEDSDRPYTLADVGQEIVCLEAKYLGAPEDVKESTHYRKNMMRLDALHLLYDSMKG